MVATEAGPPNPASDSPEGGTTFGKLRQTLSSSLLTAQDKGNFYLIHCIGNCLIPINN